MKRSTDRILTTHVGSLIRPPDIIQGMKAHTLGKPYDEQKLAEDTRKGVCDVVRRQVETGLDVINDGEFSRNGHSYFHDRLSGIEPRPADPGETVWGHQSERAAFREFFEQYEKSYRRLWMWPEVSMDDMKVAANSGEWFRVTGPIKFIGHSAVQRDIDLLKAAIAGYDIADAFITAVTPIHMKSNKNVLDFYATHEEYLCAVADAMREEYRAITDAGFILQLDYAALNPQTQILKDVPNPTPEQMRKVRDLGVEMVNYALRDIPAERVRYHHCWGSHNRPHTHDTPLRDMVHQMLKLNVQAYGFEAANPRHEHEWMVWQDVKLPEGKIVVPGVISQSTNVVEHPELVAWRIKNFASVVGKENVIAGVDCGFSQWWDVIRVHPTIQWAKLQSLVEGAALASRELWS